MADKPQFAMPDGSYPISRCTGHDSVASAALLAHHSKTYSFEQVKAHVMKAKKALGCPDSVLPATWTNSRSHQPGECNCEAEANAMNTPEEEKKPEVREKPPYERRTYQFQTMQVRSKSSEAPHFLGHAAVFNSLSEDLGGFREVIRPGAFTKSIREADVFALFNHDPNMPLARSGNGSLYLNEDKRGLAVDITPTDTTYARDLLENMEKGLITKMSFGFQPVKDDFRGDKGQMIRELHEVRLFDVSPVTFPAYPATDIQSRSILTAAGLEFEELSSVLFKHKHGVPFTLADRDLVKRSATILTGYLAQPEPIVTDHSAVKPSPIAQKGNLAKLRERLEAASRIA